MDIQELSDEEVEIIRRHRDAAAKEAERMRQRLLKLQMAAQYEQWLQENERGSSFSTFVNEFGAEACGQAQLSVLYECIQALRALVSGDHQ